tara:strand:- start:375 stop:647 length:273 start_codon:yes stop_codon:yes gene_type:complete
MAKSKAQQAAIAISMKKAGKKPKSMKKGGKNFNPKYTSGSSNVGERKRLMTEISNIYKKHRGTKAKRKKKGFPPAVAARLKKLMARRDKI